MQSLIPVLHNHAGKEKFLYMQLPQINLTNIALIVNWQYVPDTCIHTPLWVCVKNIPVMITLPLSPAETRYNFSSYEHIHVLISITRTVQ